MVKSVLGVHHSGLRDWAIQRVSAIIMGLYYLFLLGYFLTHRHLTYVEWHGLFSLTWLKIFTLFFIFGMLHHAWVGMWTIVSDYIKPFVVRLTFNVLILITLTASFVWGVIILWSV